MYTITVKIAANGTIYHDSDTSLTGHMWYSISNGSSTESYGFAPAKDSMPLWEGTIKRDDDANYGSTYYTGTIVIDYNQYVKLQNFGIIKNLDGNIFDFSSFYIGTSNSCIDYTWKALNIIGMNPSDFEGQIWPTKNADDADAALYKYLMGNLDGWDSSQPNAGDYHVIYGSNGGDVLIAELQTDAIYGGGGNDTLVGSVLNDFLVGGEGSDQLYGGGSYDTYIAGMGDTISDDDGSGEVYFEGIHLTGGTKESGQGCEDEEGESEYKGNGGTYTLTGGLLLFTDSSGRQVSITGFSNGQLGITLTNNPSDSEECEEGKCPQPVTPTGHSSSSSSESSGGSSVEGGGSSTIPKYKCVYSPDTSSAGVGGGASNTGPIVLDLNRNGITSLSLIASQALFDYDGDGIKENTAWAENTDALLVNDVNNDGIINNASELFGNYTKNSDGSIAKSGYQALSYYDTNSDGIVNTTDSRFSELKLWIDANGDGVTDTGELKTLSEMGVTSLTLNDPTTPYAPTVENTNTIIQETTFTDANGEGVMRDVLFRYENTSTNTEGVYFDMDGNGLWHVAQSNQSVVLQKKVA